MEKSDLAIVIPAYKIDFFDSALKSLSDQTNKNFTVYIGIDASKANFESVIDRYKSSISIVYHLVFQSIVLVKLLQNSL